MSSFKKTNTKLFSKPSQKVTPDSVYWKKLGVPVILKEYGAIDYVDFSPVEPYYFAVTCSVRVQIYNPITKIVYKNLSRFRENAYGGSFRSDGQLLCAGGEEGHIRLFDVKSKAVLRIFKGHTSPVHRCFFTADKTHIASFADDKSVALWDIASEVRLTQFTQHLDYVRAGATSPVSPTSLVSGCYDGMAHLYDSRTGGGDGGKAQVTVNHGAPIEDVLFLPSGGIFITAGGMEVRVWDALAGGRLLAKMAAHHKTVTSLALGTNATRLLSASLDRHVKIYDIATYRPVHTLDFPSALLSLGISANDETLVAGTVSGMVLVRRREEPVEGAASRGTKRRVSYPFAGDQFRPAAGADIVVSEDSKQVMSRHDAALRKFQHRRALDIVLAPYCANKTPHVTVALMQELIRRDGMDKALMGRESKSLMIILRFLIKYIGDYRFTRTLINVTNLLLDVFGERLDELGPETSELMLRLGKRVGEEERLTEQLLGLSGALEMILAAATTTTSAPAVPALQPSEAAQKSFVVSVT